MAHLSHLATENGRCRRCCAVCDKLVDPAACVQLGCPFLYSYDDPADGQRYVGCMNKVFRPEIEEHALQGAAATPRGFGGLRVTGTPMAHCPTTIERAVEGSGEGFACVNPEFWDADEGLTVAGRR
jgi:hypothetical protein